MYLVDTSVWVDFINARPVPHVERLKRLLMARARVGLTPVVYQEILQGAADEAIFRRFTDYFSSQFFYLPLHPVESHAAAARIYFDCRRKGITIRSTSDCLIARIAIEHDLILLHNDRDFAWIAEVAPKLKLET